MDFAESLTLFKYYLNLENELFETERYVTLERSNFVTFSIEYAKLLLSICSEIDMVLKMICRCIEKDKKCSKITHYHQVMSKTLKYFTREEVVFLYFKDIKIRPWEGWNETNPPNWWNDYNKVKHQRTDVDEGGTPFYSKANLGNVIQALAALYISELYLFYLNEPEKKPDGTDNNESIILDYNKSSRLHMNSWQGCYTFFMSRDNSRFNLRRLRELMNSRVFE